MSGRWRRIKQSHDLADSLADEAERFLRGRYLDVAFATERHVPTWVWVSALAHGDDTDMALCERWLSDHGSERPELNAWGHVLQVLAHRVRETVARTGCSLVDLQEEVLLPIELAVLEAPIGPATLNRLVESTLVSL